MTNDAQELLCFHNTVFIKDNEKCYNPQINTEYPNLPQWWL